MSAKWMILVLAMCPVAGAFGEEHMPAKWNVAQSWDIAEVPAGFPVDFCLLTDGKTQYAAYYDQHRRMTVASRTLGSGEWSYQVLPTSVGWDSHNYITMAVDNDGHLHVSGNMHGVPLIYFRTEKPGDISTLVKRSMTGENEDRCTYPRFMRDADNRLLFRYRDGGSGSGNDIYNVYDPRSQTWTRLMDSVLTNGQGKMNAYMSAPVRGPDGLFHMIWVWRDTPDCATNHHLSYVRTRDMLKYESVFGDKVGLPITLSEQKLWVDPIPSRSGLINGGQRLFFDQDNRPLVNYHKNDKDGNMQIYVARPENNEWKHYQLTEWDKPVRFGGGGSMGFIGISISGLRRVEPGVLTMTYRHRDYGNGRLVIDEKTLQPMEKTITLVPDYPEHINQVQSGHKGMGIRRAHDDGDSGDANVRYMLQWETLGRNRDQPRSSEPSPSTLRLYKLVANTDG